jgi:hypothetical protein
MEEGLNTEQKKAWAKDMYTRDNLSQKEIALKVGSTEQSVNAWIAEGSWEAMRKVMRSRRQEQLNMLYDMLDLVNKAGLEAIKDESLKVHPDTDKILKLTTAIGKLESETGLGDMADALMAFINWMMRQDHPTALIINKWADKFIKMKLNEYN